MKPVVLYTISKTDPSPGNSVALTAPDGDVLWRTLVDREETEKKIRALKGCLGTLVEAEKSGQLDPFYQTKVQRVVDMAVDGASRELPETVEMWVQESVQGDKVLGRGLLPADWFGVEI